MGNSTISLQKILDRISGKGIPTPLTNPAGYSADIAVSMGNDCMSDILSPRFNWKWNRKNAAAFYTNSYQQDYPQLALTDVAWLEDADRVDYNNTAIPKPMRQMTVRRQLSRTSAVFCPSSEICWMYNDQLSYGTWPGAHVTFYPLITTQVRQNSIMSMVDANGNLLIVTVFGTTGTVAPLAALSAAEGVTVVDGTVTWTVVGPKSQGFRIFPMPGATGPVFQITPYYQMKSPTLTTLQSLIDPIPDGYSGTFQKGMECYCLEASPNPGDKERGQKARGIWIASMLEDSNQANRESDAYAMLPASSPVSSVYDRQRNPQDPSEPF